MEIIEPGDGAVCTIQQLIDKAALLRGERIFLVSPELQENLSFAGLQKQSKAIAIYLHQAGLVCGDKVAFLLDNGLFTVQLFFGTMYAGLVSVPLNVRAGVTQLTYTLEHCEAKVLFVQEQYAALANEALAGVGRPVLVVSVNVNGLAQDLLIPGSKAETDEIQITTPTAEDVALLMYTSGSVGAPRAAIHSHRTLLAHGRNSMRSHQLTEKDRSLLVLPIYHINAECVTLMPTLLSGGAVVAPHHFNVSQFWDWLDEHECTWSAIVPTMVAQLLDWKDPKAGQRAAAFRRIRFIRSSSAPLSPSMQREFMERFPIRLIQAMGSSEAGNIFSNPQAPGENKLGTPGPAWGFETRIVNPEGVDVKTGQTGEVLLRGPAITRGYYRDPEQTAAVFDEAGWLHTGDLAHQDTDGYFYIVGRSKELIIKGGMNIAPRQIDEVLESHPSVLEAAAVGIPDHYLGEDLAAFVVLREGMQGDEREMLTFCESRLGHFKTPTRIHFVKDLPKGPSGKVQRLRLLDQNGGPAGVGPLDSKGYRSGEDQVAAGKVAVSAAAIAEIIAHSWAAVLNIAEVDHDANFFSYGGHSLTAIQCLSRLREKLPVPLSLSDFFENPTVAQQVALVGQRLSANGSNNGHIREGASVGTHSTTPVSPIKPTAFPLVQVRGRSWSHPVSVDQRRIWLSEELASGAPLYNEAEAVRLRGHLCADAMEDALNQVVARHETLRTTFQKIEGNLVAAVQATWTLRIKHVDLSSLTPQERQSELDRLLVHEPSAPYHLATTPGIRATLVRLDADCHVFILMMHHLVCDWASIGQLWREFSAAYRAIVRGEQLTAAPLAIQFGDYVIWQQQRIAEASFDEDLMFWESNLRGAPDLLDLPSDRPRSQLPSHRGAKQRFWLGTKLTRALRELSHQQKTSPFVVFTAAFITLLYRYSGSEDISLGIPIGNRERPELQQLIGFLLHTHVLRTRLATGMRFRDLLPIVQSGILALYSHREAPFDEVVSRINPHRSLDHSPLFQVMLNWRDGDQQPTRIGLEGLELESIIAEARTAKFDLTLMVTDDKDEIWLEAEYSTDLFDGDRIGRLFRHYQTLLESLAADPDLPLDHIPLLTSAERHQLVVDWNATKVADSQELLIHQLFEQQSVRTPHSVAVVYADQSISYQELDQRSNKLARRLRALGVAPKSLIAICLDRSIEMASGLLAILKAGCAYLPLDPAYPRERLAFMLADSAASLIITESKFRSALPENWRTLCLDDDWTAISSQAASALEMDSDSSSLAYVIYTSGSTGRPKGVEITHRSVVNLLASTRKRPGLDRSDNLLAVTTLSFDIAALELFLPLAVGATVTIASRETARDGGALLELLQSSHATVIQATPITFRMLIAAGWSPAGRHLKVLCGGEALPQTLADEILDRADELWNCYGPTETTIYSSVAKVLRNAPITIGRPIDNTRFYILDVNGELCPTGRAGELHIAGDGLARGYLRRPELTVEKFVAEPFSGEAGARMYKTGDLARYLPDGNVEYLGRIDQQVKIHGFRIELGEIEAALKQEPSIGQCVVVATEDRTGDKQLTAYLVPAGRDPVPGSENLRDQLRQSLPEYMLPKAFVTLQRLPLTLNGKIDRKALPAPELGAEGVAAVPIAPRTPIEEVLAQIWKEVLGVKEISIRDNFFALGGDSLRATMVIAGVVRLLNQKVSVQTLFQKPTIEKMAQAISVQAPGSASEERQLLHVVLREGAKSLCVLSDDARWVALQRGDNRLPFFIIDSFPYFIDVVELLGEEQPVISIVSRERAQASSSYDVINEAASHVATILECQQQGPYLLGGCSASGVIAYEVAQQLQARGHTVGLVALFDTVNPYFMREYSPLRRSLAHNSAELRRLRWYEIPQWIAAKITGYATNKVDAVRALARKDDEQSAREESQFGLSPSRIDAVRKYRPMLYKGRLLLFKRQRELGGRYRDPELGWGEVAEGRIEVCPLNGSSHLEIFKAVADRALVARKLKSSFDEVEKAFETEARQAILNRRAHKPHVRS